MNAALTPQMCNLCFKSCFVQFKPSEEHNLQDYSELIRITAGRYDNLYEYRDK